MARFLARAARLSPLRSGAAVDERFAVAGSALAGSAVGGVIVLCSDSG
jgi:hypothetical protein